MTHKSRLRALEASVSPPVGVGSLLDEPCQWCGSSPVKLRFLLKDKRSNIYPPPVGMVSCSVCKLPGWSGETYRTGQEEGWFEPGGWIHDLYAERPLTQEDYQRLQRTREVARAAAGRG